MHPKRQPPAGDRQMVVYRERRCWPQRSPRTVTWPVETRAIVAWLTTSRRHPPRSRARGCGVEQQQQKLLVEITTANLETARLQTVRLETEPPVEPARRL